MLPDERPHALIPEPPRIKRLRLMLAKAIPKVPNNREALRQLEEKGISLLLIDYLNWHARFVGVRPRKVVIGPEMRSDAKWADHALAVEALLKKVERGEDLTPYLSILPHTEGVAVRAGKQGATAKDKWSDKDFILHGMNYHHFHLGQKNAPKGYIERTNDVLFAEVTRDEFRAVGIFDHSVFEHHSVERQRLWRIHHRISFQGHAPGAILLGAQVTLSGHTLDCVHYAQYCMKKVRHFEPLLDDRAFTESLFASASLEAPRRTNFAWGFNHLDIGVLERISGKAFIFTKGWN